MSKKFSATISCDYGLWMTFKTWAKQQNSSASEEISKFMWNAVSSNKYVSNLYEERENLESLFRKLINEELNLREAERKELEHISNRSIEVNNNNLALKTDSTDDTGDTDLVGSTDDTVNACSTGSTGGTGSNEGTNINDSIKSIEKVNSARERENNLPADSNIKPESLDKEELNLFSRGVISPEKLIKPHHILNDQREEAKDKSLNTDDTGNTDSVISADNTENTYQELDTENTDNTDSPSQNKKREPDKLYSDRELKEIENLTENKSTITRWRNGKRKIPEGIAQKYKVEGTRWRYLG